MINLSVFKKWGLMKKKHLMMSSQSCFRARYLIMKSMFGVIICLDSLVSGMDKKAKLKNYLRHFQKFVALILLSKK